MTRGVQTQLTEELIAEMRDFAERLNPDLGPMFGRDVVRLADAYLAQQRALAEVQAVVDEQAEDEALWALNLDGTLPISEAYLQQELRRLHAVVERAVSVGSPETRETKP